MTSNTYNQTAGGFGALASAFVLDSIGSMISWIIVMTFVIIADFVAGTAKSVKLGQKVRFSKASRDTLAKFCTYYSVVVCACMTKAASQLDYDIAESACLLIIIIEGVSIFSNILKWHGYDLDFAKIVGLIIGKKFSISADEIKDSITKDNGNRSSKVGSEK